MAFEKRELEVQKWFDDMESSQGTYRGADESNRRLLHERLMSRLDGNYVMFRFQDVLGFGTGHLDAPVLIDLHDADMNGVSSDVAFSTHKGHIGCVTIDWDMLTLRFSDTLLYSVSNLDVMTVDAISPTQVVIGFDVALSKCAGDEPIGLLDFNVSREHIMKGVIEQMSEGCGYLPERPLTSTLISDITGFHRSSLSLIKNGTKEFDKLMYASLVNLSLFGHITFLDSKIYRALVDYVSGSVGTYMTDELVEFDTRFDVVVLMRDGRKYTMTSDSEYRAMELYRGLTTRTNGSSSDLLSTHLYLRDVVDNDGVYYIALGPMRRRVDSVYVCEVKLPKPRRIKV